MEEKNQQYEVTILSVKEGVDKEVSKIIEELGGKIANVHNWGKRKLTYSIAGRNSADYATFVLTLPGNKIVRLNSKLKNSAEIIRHLITDAVKKKDPSLILDKKITNVIKNEGKASGLKPTAAPKPKNIQEETIDETERLKNLEKKLKEILSD